MEVDVIADSVSSWNNMAALFSFIAAVLVYVIISTMKKSSRKVSHQGKKMPPEVAGAWPIIGHLPQLVGPHAPHITLANMSDKFGPIFTIWQGVYPTVVVSSSDLARECFTVNDAALADRPDLISFILMGYNLAMMGFAPYGDYWREVRKIASVEVLSSRRLKLFRHVRESEVMASLKRAFDTCALNGQSNSDSDSEGHRRGLVEMKTWLGDIILNIVFRVVLGKRLVGEDDSLSKEERNKQCRKAFRQFVDLAGGFLPSDALPFLRCLDLGGKQKAMKKVAGVLDKFMDEWLDEHKDKARLCGGYSEEFFEGEHDFMDVMLSVVERDGIQRLGNFGADTVIKATCLALIIAGTDTTMMTMTWALSLLLNNPEALKKAQEELDIQVGRERLVDESDLHGLVYLQAILKETMRLYPAAPLSLPHQAKEDCTVGGYHIPAGTRLLSNLYKIHIDPNVWTDPLEFKPERFLTTHKDVDVKGQNFELIPFGSGRRMCPGMSFAVQTMQFTLANLLQAFHLENPSNEPVDMTEQTGLTNSKAMPLDVLLAPRLRSHIYKGLDAMYR